MMSLSFVRVSLGASLLKAAMGSSGDTYACRCLSLCARMSAMRHQVCDSCQPVVLVRVTKRFDSLRFCHLAGLSPSGFRRGQWLEGFRLPVLQLRLRLRLGRRLTG